MSQYAHQQGSQPPPRRGTKMQMPTTSGGPLQSLQSQPPMFPYNPQPEDLMLPPQQDLTSPPSRKRKAPGMPNMGGLSSLSAGLGDPGGLGDAMDPALEATSPITAPKKSRTNTPWTPAEEQRLKTMRDSQSSWGEIAKTFPNRTEGSVKKHWYKDMHYADFAEDESAALLTAIKEYEASKWKVIGQKVGKPAKACEQYAKEHFAGRI